MDKEAKGIRGDDDNSIPWDVVVINHFKSGKHLFLDGVVISIYRKNCIRSISTLPEFTSKEAEVVKLCTDRASRAPVSIAYGGYRVLMSCAIEDGGRLGTHAHVFLLELARRAVPQSRHNRAMRFDSCGVVAKGERVTHVSLWVQR